jgi:hypothetical protein
LGFVSPSASSADVVALPCASSAVDAPGPVVETSLVEGRGLSQVSQPKAPVDRPAVSTIASLKAPSSAPRMDPGYRALLEASGKLPGPAAQAARPSRRPAPRKAVSEAQQAVGPSYDYDLPLDPGYVYVPEPPEDHGPPSPELQRILDMQKAFNAAGKTSVRPTYRKPTKVERDRWLWTPTKARRPHA